MKKVGCIILALIVWFPFGAKARISDSLKHELQKISTEMFLAHNDNFIIVDALIDGYVVPGGKASIINKDSLLTINDEPIPDPRRGWYLDKIKAFYAAQQTEQDRIIGASTSSGFYVTILKINLADIVNRKSSFRTYTPPPQLTRAEVDKQQKDLAEFRQMLATDKLIDTTQYYIVRYNILGFFVNEQRAEEHIAEKYIRYLNAHWLTVKDKEDMMYITNTDFFISHE